jgi:hypothetical protein
MVSAARAQPKLPVIGFFGSEALRDLTKSAGFDREAARTD